MQRLSNTQKSLWLPSGKIWLLFAVVTVIEFFLFKYYVSRNISHFYPSGFDQTSYLIMSYRLYENIKQFGFIKGIVQSETLPTGMLFPIQAALFYLLFGASRLSALLLNFIYFILLQFFALLALRSFSSKTYLSLALLGLIYCIKTPFLNAGDLMDFRMDFIAFCLYGIFTCIVIRSKIFLDRKWSLITGIVICLSILLRCITVVYLAGVMASLFIYFLYTHKKAEHASLEKQQSKKRLANIFLAGITCSIPALPCLWLNRFALYHYYVGNHIIGSERHIRALEEGVTNFISRLSYYPSSLFSLHLDTLCLLSAGILLFTYIFLYCMSTKRSSQTHSIWKKIFIFLFFCIFIPLIALTADTIKSPVVGSIIVIPSILFIFWICLYLDSKFIPSKHSETTLKIVASLILFLGLYNQIHELRHFPSKTKLQNANTITKMYLDIGDYALARHWPNIRLSVDHISDYLTSLGLAVIYYETRNKYLQVDIQRLGGSIFAIHKEEAINSLEHSNVFIFNLNNYPSGSAYPFNQTIEPLRPLLQSIAEQRFLHLGDYAYMNSTYRVYVAAN